VKTYCGIGVSGADKTPLESATEARMRPLNDNLALPSFRTQWWMTAGVVLLCLVITGLVVASMWIKVAVLLFAVIGLLILFANPEWGLIFSFSSGIFKEWLSFNVPVFAQFDFTIAIYLLTFIAIFWHQLKHNRLFELSLHRSMLPLLLFTGLMIFSIAYTPSFKYGSFKAFSFFFFNWALFLFPLLLIRDLQSAEKVLKNLVVLAAGIAVFTLVSLVNSLRTGSILYTYRSSFLGINPISFANWVGAIAILLVAYMPLIRGRRWRWSAYLTVFLLFATLVAANSRGPLAAFIVTAGSIGLIRFRKKPLGFWVGWILLAVAVSALLLLVLPEQVTSRYVDLVVQKKGMENVTFFTVQTRLYNWQAAWAMASESIRNFLIGAGNGAFSQNLFGQDVRWYPHNMLLEVLSELGMVGVLLLVWHFIAIARLAIASYRSLIDQRARVLLFAFSTAAIFNLIGAQFSGDLNDNRRLWFFLGLVITTALMAQPETPAGRDGKTD
jgi:O-antigen ligase